MSRINRKLYELKERIKSEPPDLLKSENLPLSPRSESVLKKGPDNISKETSLYFPPIKTAKPELEIILEIRKPKRKKPRNISLDVFISEDFDIASPKISFDVQGKHMEPKTYLKRKDMRLTQQNFKPPTPKQYFNTTRYSAINPSPWPISSTDKLKLSFDES